MVSIEDFAKLELKIAEIKEVTEHPNADRLYVIKIDLGGEERQVVAGIRASYQQKDELIGKKVCVVANLDSATIRGEESQGMILAGSDGDAIILGGFDGDLPPGARVK